LKHHKANKINFFSRLFFLAFFFCLPFNTVHAEKSPLKIRVGIFQNKPVVFQDEQGTAQGLYVDLLNEISKQNKLQLEFVFDSWANSLKRLRENDIDLMTSIAYTKERDSYFDYSQENILTMWGQVYVGEKLSVENILELEGLKVAILRNGINGINFQKLCEAFNIQCQLLAVDTYEEAVSLVEMGKTDACVINNVRGYDLEEKYKIRKSPIMFNPFKLLFAVPEGKHDNILRILDEQLKYWKQHDDSFYYQTVQHWYGGKLSSKKVIPQWLIYFLIIISGIILIALIWVMSLQYQTKKLGKTEGALLKSEERFRNVYSTAPLAFVIWDAETRITDWNKKSEEVFGWLKEEVVGHTFFDLIIPEKDRPHVHEVVNNLINGDLPGHSINDNLTKDGQIITCEWSNSSLHGDDGNIMGAISLGLDITERKQAEKSLEKSEERLKLALDSVSDAVCDWRVDTGEVFFSSRWYTMLGYEPYELPQTFETWKSLLHSDDLHYAESTIKRHLESGEPFEIEIRMRTHNNQWKWILARGKMVERAASGAATRMLGTHVDITERKKAEEEKNKLHAQLRHTQKMEAIGTLAGGIAHDFNNILAAVLGYVELAQANLPPESPEASYIQKVYQAGLRARDLVKQILTFSRQAKEEIKPIKIQLVIKEALKLLRASIPTTIEIKQNIFADCGLIMVDPTHIHQIIMNLCTNAYHAMRDTGGILAVTLEQVEVRPDDLVNKMELLPGQYVRLEVRDTGCGMDKLTMERIFEPYYTTKDKGEGTGLGLAVVHGILKSYDGNIKVYSEPGQGTTFSIYLPVIKEAQDIIQTQVDDLVPKGAERILLVDDEAYIAEIEKQMLERLGYQVKAQISSIDALNTFRVAPDQFDVVITDMTMPNMTGDKLSMELKKIRPDIPIIICSGFSELMSDEKAEAIGIKGFLTKPVLRKDLAKKIREVLDRK
jgi:PAS domain S-box-containing protein